MYESADIAQYLVDTYGDGSGVVPNGITNGYGSTLAMGLALAPRIGKGSKVVAGVRTWNWNDKRERRITNLLTYCTTLSHTHTNTQTQHDRPPGTRSASRWSTGGTRPPPSAASSRRSSTRSRSRTSKSRARGARPSATS